MLAKGIFYILCAILGVFMTAYGILAAMGKAPVFSLVPAQSEKQRRREQRLHAIGYGGMGLLAILEPAYFFTQKAWILNLTASLRTILTLYLVCALTVRVYIRGYIPGDSFDQ